MDFSSEEILETIRMVQMERMDIRCVTLGIDLHDCVSARASVLALNVHRKVTRLAERLVRTCDELADELGLPIVNKRVSVTPVAEILELMGLERCGTHGTTAALSLMVNAVKTGGAMASSYVGGLSGAFIPISEDEGMVRAVRAGALGLPKLEALTAVCSVGIDMVALPGKTSAETVAGIIADEMAIGVAHNKTTGARLIPVPGARAGQLIDFGGLLGTAPVMAVSRFSCERFVHRGGRIPAPLRALTN